MGYDDIDFAAAAAVPLTPVRQPREQLGRAAMELLLEEATDPHEHQHRQLVFEPELVVRESTVPGYAAMRVVLFTTCLVDGLFPDVGKATVRPLRRLGHEVEVPRKRTCCGQMHVNAGYPHAALPLIENHVATFTGYRAIVAPSEITAISSSRRSR